MRYFVIITFCCLNFKVVLSKKVHLNILPTQKFIYSSKNLFNEIETIIVKDKQVIAMKKSDVSKNGMVLTDQNGKPQAVPVYSNYSQNSDTVIKDGYYLYYTPKDGQYFLENGAKFTIQNGQMVKIGSNPIKNLQHNDIFFEENESKECKIAKFNFAQQLLINRKAVKYHQYQIELDSNMYPDLVRLIIVAEKDIMQPNEYIKYPRFPESGKKINGLPNNLIALYFSYKNDIGCVPYSDFKLYGDQEAQRFNLYLPKYRLIGKYTGIAKEKKFLSISGPKVKFYNQKLIDYWDKTVVDNSEDLNKQFNEKQKEEMEG